MIYLTVEKTPKKWYNALKIFKDIRAFMKTYMISFYKKFDRIKSIDSVRIL